MTARITLLAFALAACSSKAPTDDGRAAARSAASTAAASVPTQPPTNRWRRAPASEPDPAAKGLYRQATELVRDGRLAQAEPLFDQILNQHPKSRFARRLQTEGFPIVEAARVGTVVLMFGVGAFLFSGGK